MASSGQNVQKPESGKFRLESEKNKPSERLRKDDDKTSLSDKAALPDSEATLKSDDKNILNSKDSDKKISLDKKSFIKKNVQTNKRNDQTVSQNSYEAGNNVISEDKKLNTSKLSMEKSAAKLEAAYKNLITQSISPQPGLLKNAGRMAKFEAWAYTHGKIYQVENENVGIKAAHRTELIAEGVVRSLSSYVKRRIRNRPARLLRKQEKLATKARADYQYKALVAENPELKKSALKGFLQKKRLRKQYKQAQATAKGAGSVVSKVTAVTDKMGRAVAVFAKSSPAATVIILICLMLILILQSCTGSAFIISNSIVGAVGGTSYLAEDEDIDDAVLYYTEWEVDLLLEALNAETSHPGYDEYIFEIMEMSHNPFEILAFLTTKYNDFTFAEVYPTLRELFAEQYTLSFIPSVEIRYRTETHESSWTDDEGNSHSETYEVEVPYEWHILTVSLTSRSFTEIVMSRLTTQAERERFNVYMLLHGNRQLVGSPFPFNWLQHVSGFYGYRIGPISGIKELHTGVDIALSSGTEILVGGSGIVTFAGDHGGYGLTVVIDYGRGVSARYAHCSELLVSVGQSVEAGDVIALVGSTGNSTGPHLHMEVIKNGRFLNPLFFVDGTQGGSLPGSPSTPIFPEFPGAPMDDARLAALIAEAMRHLGKPYVWGASGPNAFDCSGFIFYILNQSGAASVPRTTAQGYFNMSTPIPPSEARPGDLVFFHSTFSSPNTVTHIGLYLGDGWMVHAGSPVSYEYIGTNFWRNHFYAFARLS